MTIDWLHFTPLASLAGGVLIGIAVAILILFNGKILGICGIIGGLMPPRSGDMSWRLWFLLGVLIAPLLLKTLISLPAPRIDSSYVVLVAAGLLVGFGTRLGSGCTSGHGICGISRLSPRSLVATPLFMLAGFATVFVVRHLIG